MKKKLILAVLFLCILMVGCGKNNAETAFKDLTNKINKLNAYSLSGTLDVKNINNTYNYNVSVSFMKNDKFKVSLVNTSNNHEQVILRNDDGVFVLTPSLNKSFKFQSDWPYNNSQIYLLGSIIEDLNSDSEGSKKESNGQYIFTSKVNYPNNNKLICQRVTVNSDLMIEKVEVLNENDEVEMTFTIKNIDYNPTFDEAYFSVNSIINTNNNSNTETKEEKESPANENNSKDTNVSSTSYHEEQNIKRKLTASMNGEDILPTATLDDIIYPLYLPNGTVLKEQEKVSKTDGERVILTFAGDKGFTLVEETANRENEFTIVPTYGEPGFINGTIGALTDNSLNWISNNVEYYMVSEVMNTVELLDIANSINVKAVASLK